LLGNIRAIRAMAKRIFDVAASFAGLILMLPFFLLIGILIKMDSCGPVFYRGVRIGRNGKPFRIYKFRSMVANAEEIGSTATAHNDPRITRMGKLIRKYKIDELPQLINVIKGEMSIVGPRPEVEEHVKSYRGEEEIILTMRPGITDNSSLRFMNLNELLGTEDPNKVFIDKYRTEKNRLRAEYVKNQSFWGDVRIIFDTLCRIVRN
jgi:lipopolysaccharide/colanic/teichoic acid biosynthesis glycosyltransferase